VTPLKEERRASLKKKKVKNYKVTLNALTAGNKDIMPETVTRNQNKIERLK
jgi:hypothetical protein